MISIIVWCFCWGLYVWWWHDDVIKWKHFPLYWPFVQGIHLSPVNSPHKGQWRGALMFSLICAWINCWVNNRKAGDLRCHHAHYDVTVMRNIELVGKQLFTALTIRDLSLSPTTMTGQLTDNIHLLFSYGSDNHCHTPLKPSVLESVYFNCRIFDKWMV